MYLLVQALGRRESLRTLLAQLERGRARENASKRQGVLAVCFGCIPCVLTVPGPVQATPVQATLAIEREQTNHSTTTEAPAANPLDFDVAVPDMSKARAISALQPQAF